MKEEEGTHHLFPTATSPCRYRVHAPSPCFACVLSHTGNLVRVTLSRWYSMPSPDYSPWLQHVTLCCNEFALTLRRVWLSKDLGTHGAPHELAPFDPRSSKSLNLLQTLTHLCCAARAPSSPCFTPSRPSQHRHGSLTCPDPPTTLLRGLARDLEQV